MLEYKILILNSSKNDIFRKDSNYRKSESQAGWKQVKAKDPKKSPQNQEAANDPSIETIKRSFSQLNLNNARRTYHKRFLSKPSLSISRVNSSAYYNKPDGIIQSRLNHYF